MTDVQISALIFVIFTTGVLMYASYRCGRHDAYTEGFTDGSKATRRTSQRLTGSQREALNPVEKEVAA